MNLEETSVEEIRTRFVELMSDGVLNDPVVEEQVLRTFLEKAKRPTLEAVLMAMIQSADEEMLLRLIREEENDE